MGRWHRVMLTLLASDTIVSAPVWSSGCLEPECLSTRYCPGAGQLKLGLHRPDGPSGRQEQERMDLQPRPQLPDGEARSFLDAIRRIARELREASREAEARLGLSAAQLYVLHQLREAGPLSISTLASRTFTHQSSVSTVVSRLETLGLVQRRNDPNDRRSVLVSLSPQGEERLTQAPEPVQERLLATFAALPDADRRELARLLEGFSLQLNQESLAQMLFEDERPQPT
jgi:DNA-binding MarR family transcriptional regulator